jgi:hypothetical protein
MRLLRRHRLRSRLSILAMVALLWSQLVLAAHPGCVASAGMPAEPASAAAHGCGHEAMPAQSPVCESHCSQGGVSGDVARVPPVPPLPAMVSLPLAALAVPQAVSLRPAAIDGPPPVPWHRPTAHPAALLLI